MIHQFKALLESQDLCWAAHNPLELQFQEIWQTLLSLMGI